MPSNVPSNQPGSREGLTENKRNQCQLSSNINVNPFVFHVCFLNVNWLEVVYNTKIKIAPSIGKRGILIRILVTVSIYKGLRMICESHLLDMFRWTRPHFKGAALIKKYGFRKSSPEHIRYHFWDYRWRYRV